MTNSVSIIEKCNKEILEFEKVIKKERITWQLNAMHDSTLIQGDNS